MLTLLSVNKPSAAPVPLPGTRVWSCSLHTYDPKLAAESDRCLKWQPLHVTRYISLIGLVLDYCRLIFPHRILRQTCTLILRKRNLDPFARRLATRGP